ncbi:hypothetical protein [Verrucomicrobium spinosum]|uniref:hypothetical protein n=1 Tax=Verrucomicrobium spinosum TaxID=2736 RepID=UPI0009468529|nr:hypothetical protein [Verrucomicrobium spinosum]
MQVSWIDEDELRALTSQLQGAFPEPKAGAPVGSSFPEVNEAVIANLLEGGPLPSSTSFARPAPTAPVPAPVRVAETSPAPADVPGGSLPPVVAVAVEAPLAVVPQMHVSVITLLPNRSARSLTTATALRWPIFVIGSKPSATGLKLRDCSPLPQMCRQSRWPRKPQQHPCGPLPRNSPDRRQIFHRWPKRWRPSRSQT